MGELGLRGPRGEGGGTCGQTPEFSPSCSSSLPWVLCARLVSMTRGGCRGPQPPLEPSAGPARGGGLEVTRPAGVRAPASGSQPSPAGFFHCLRLPPSGNLISSVFRAGERDSALSLAPNLSPAPRCLLAKAVGKANRITGLGQVGWGSQVGGGRAQVADGRPPFPGPLLPQEEAQAQQVLEVKDEATVTALWTHRRRRGRGALGSVVWAVRVGAAGGSGAPALPHLPVSPFPPSSPLHLPPSASLPGLTGGWIKGLDGAPTSRTSAAGQAVTPITGAGAGAVGEEPGCPPTTPGWGSCSRPSGRLFRVVWCPLV